MKGFPKWLNSKEDYLYVKDNFLREQWADKFQTLLDERLAWFNIGELAASEEGVTDDTHKVVEIETMGEETKKRYQYELKENPDCMLYRLGFTVDEIQAILD